MLGNKTKKKENPRFPVTKRQKSSRIQSEATARSDSAKLETLISDAVF